MRTRIYILIFVLVLSGASSVYAQEANSGSFRTIKKLLDSFGGNASSTGFMSVLSGGQSFTGESTSSNFTLHSGFLYFDSYTPKTQNWRWYDDETSVTPSTPLAAENVAPSAIESSYALKLRLTIKETADIGATGIKFKLQYSTTSDFSSEVKDVEEVLDCAGGDAWCYYNGAGVDNALIPTATLSDADACVASVGNGCGSHNESGTTTSTITQAKSAATEYEFTIQMQVAAAPNTVYFFRPYFVLGSSTVPVNSSESYPSLSTGGTILTFTIDGVADAVATEGIITDASTTPTVVDFGLLPLGSQVQAAQRLTVTTNAVSGYKIFAYQRQGFLNGTGGEIDPITSTNSSPAGWGTGCGISAVGCYGYHSGEDVLEGGSTRFAPNDSYARFTSSLEEVAHSSAPVVDKVTDMVYQLEVRSGEETGNFSTNLVYIITPVF